MQKWKTLFQQLEVIETSDGQAISSEEELFTFEMETGIILPSEYKDFCQVFGSGRFGDLVKIFCPSRDLLFESIESIKYLKEQVEKYPSKNRQWDRQIQTLLNSALMFGGDDRVNIALWDLRTYEESDKSYDIYWVKYDDFEDEIYRVGRIFFDFVHDFCLGRKSYKRLPKSMRPEPCNTFTRIKY